MTPLPVSRNMQHNKLNLIVRGLESDGVSYFSVKDIYFLQKSCVFQ